MNKAINFLKANKKIIIIVLALIISIAILYFINVKSDNGKQTANFTQKTETEIKLASILSNIKNVGNVDVMISEGENGEICGVIIVCDGANNIMTRNDILNAVSTALNVSKNLIAIYSMTI